MLYTVVLLELVLVLVLDYQSKGRNRNLQKIMGVVIFLTLALVSSFRYSSDIRAHSDFYRNYYNTYRTAFIDWSDLWVWREELLHPILRKLLMTLTGDPQSYFFVTGFFIVGSYLYGFRKYAPNYNLAILLFYCIGGYFTAHNVTRQFIAVAIMLYSIRYIVEKKPVWFAFTVLIASGFHISCLIMIPLYFLSGIRFNRNVLYLYILAAVAMVVFRRQVTAVFQLFYYSEYGSGYGSEGANTLRLIWPLITVGCLWLMNRRRLTVSYPNRNDESMDTRFNNLICHGSVMYVFFSLLAVTNMLLFSRIASYFSFFSLLAMMYGVNSAKTAKNRSLMTIALLLLVLAWFVVNNYMGRLNPTPYTPFWSDPNRLVL